MGWLLTEWKRLRPYFTLLDFSSRPSTKVAWVVRVIVVAFGALVVLSRVGTVTAPLLDAKEPAHLPTEELEGFRFRLPERTRREIFAAIAEREASDRANAIRQNTWNGHVWSREDDRGQYERVFLRQIGVDYKISLSQAYLVLDEGIRERWPGPDGEPLTPFTPPFDPRRTW